MKLKKIAALCKKYNRAIIYQRWYQRKDGSKFLDRQFISDGFGAYAAHGLPALNKQTLLRIFDVEEKDFSKWHVSILDLPENLCLDDDMDGELEIRRFFWPIVRNDTVLRRYGTQENGILFVDESRLQPFGDAYEVFQRKSKDGQSYLAYKKGLMLEGIVLPVKVITDFVLEEQKEILFRMQKEYLNRGLPEIILENSEMEASEEMDQMEL